MKAKVLIYSLLAVALVGLVFDTSSAQDDRRGTAGASELLVPLTARAASMSAPVTSGLGDLNPLEAVVANPAGLTSGGVSGTAALFSRTEYVADIGINYFGAAQAFGNNVLAVTVSSWDFGDLPLTTETVPELSDLTYDASNVVFGVSYARQFTDRIAAGVTVKGVNEDIDDVSASGVAFDAGMTYVAGESGLRFGVALKHFGPQMQFSGIGLTNFAVLPDQESGAKQNAVNIESEAFELPSQLNVGVAYTRQVGSSADVTFMGNFASNSFSQDQYAGGLELGVMNLVYLRGGLMLVEESDFTFYKEYNLGAGLNLDLGGSRLTVDYAFLPTEFFDDVNMFSVGFEL
jgi:hypothetical protein